MMKSYTEDEIKAEILNTLLASIQTHNEVSGETKKYNKEMFEFIIMGFLGAMVFCGHDRVVLTKCVMEVTDDINHIIRTK